MRAAGFVAAGIAFATACLTVSAARNLVRNPSFEESDEMGDPAHWGWWGSDAGELADAEVFDWEPEGHCGKWSVSIREECWDMRGRWHAIVPGVKPRRWYSVSLWAKRDRPTGWLPELDFLGQRMVMNLYKEEVWQKFDWLVKSGDLQGDVVLKLINSRKPYKVWFDDVVVEEFCVEGDLDGKAGKLGWQSTETSRLVVFRVEAARSERFEDSIVLAETLSNEIAIPKNLGWGKWYWRVKAFQNVDLLAISPAREIVVEESGTAVAVGLPSPAAQESLPPLRPESSDYISFDENLNLVVDGKAFFPIGIYSLPPEKFREARRAGFNTVLTAEVEDAQRSQLRAIVPRGFRYEATSGRTATAFSQEANRSIIARYLWDEPCQNNVSPRQVFEAHKEEKKGDPYHPTAVVIYRPENFSAYASVSDIFMTDPYPIPHRPMSVVSESVRAARKAVRDRKPVWAVIQAFNWADSSQEARRTGWARWPTFQEERCMAYLAAINGAKGILFFKYCGNGKHDPLNWRALKRVAAEMKKLSPILLGRTLAIPVSVDAEAAPGTGEAKGRIEFAVKSDGKRTYLIAANNWPGTRQATFSFERRLGPFAMVPLEGRRIGTDRQSFSDTFEPYGVHVYELSFR